MKRFSVFLAALRRRLKPPRRLRFTRLGTGVVLLTMGIGFGALNTGNNLVYMIFGMMLGFITASGILSEMSLRQLDFSWILPSDPAARKPAVLRLGVRNRKSRFPTVGIEIESSLRRVLSGEAQPLAGRVLYLAAGRSAACDFPFTPSGRGEYALGALTVRTRFPFGFFVKSFEREIGGSFIAIPEIRPLPRRPAVPSQSERRWTQPAKGPGDSFWEIRSFSHGDNPRRISWKTSAKQARLMVWETEREADRRFVLRVNSAPDWSGLDPRSVEEAVSHGASYLFRRFKEGHAVGLVSDAGSVPPEPSRKALRDSLKVLALFDPASCARSPDRLLPFESSALDLLSLWRES